MKLLRLGEKGKEKPAVLASETEALDVSSLVKDFDPDFFAQGGLVALKAALDQGKAFPKISLGQTRIGAPIAKPGSFLCIGLNYSDHAKETGASIPESPIVFTKAASAINGPYDDVLMPSNYSTVDYEVELAFVIGKRARKVSKSDALGYVAGYLVCNDVSERTAQKEGQQWFRGKSFESFAPLGPWLVTPDEISDPHQLRLTCSVDGELRQDGNTRTFIFDIPTLIEFLSRNVALEPGDIITTGTPPGVGMGFKPPRYLKVGQVMELEIPGLGRQKSRLVQEA